MNTPLTPPQAPSVPYYVRALAMGFPAIMLGLQISGWLFFISTLNDGYPDFSANYTAGRMIDTGQVRRLYSYEAFSSLQHQLIPRRKEPMLFIHPAYEALAYTVFSLTSFQKAYFAFLLINLALLFFCYRLLCTELEPLEIVWQPLPIVLCLTFLPVGVALMQGQDSVLLLTLFVCAWVLMKKGYDLVAGILLGLGVFRFQFLVPMYLLFLLWKRWRVGTGLTISAGICLLVSLAMVGFGGAKVYVESLVSMGSVAQIPGDQYSQPVQAMASLRALLSQTLSPWISRFWLQFTIAIVSIAILLWLRKAAQAGATTPDLFLLAVTASAVLGYHVLIHDLAILVLPMGVWLGRSIDAEQTHDYKRRYILWGSGLVFACPVLLAVTSQFYWLSLPILAFMAIQVRFQSQRLNPQPNLAAVRA